MKWRSRHSAGVVLLVLATACYVYFIHRSVDIKDADGWHLRFSYLPFHCRVCMGRVEELDYDGVAVAVPRWRECTVGGSTPMIQIDTPVGRFMSLSGGRAWRLGHYPLDIKDVDEAVQPEELSRGWYDAASPDAERFYFVSGPFVRKKETPAGWCLLTTPSASRWVAPDRISGLDW